MKQDKKRRAAEYLVPIAGTIFCIAYVLAATNDVVYSDYIRLVNSYLPDVWNPEKFFVADILTRIPANFLERIINVAFFGYSTTFDMVLGVLCRGGAAVILTAYCRERKVGWGWYLLLMAVLFSLSQWEMLTNGTGWCHFLAFAGFYLHYRILDQVFAGRRAGIRETKAQRIGLMVLPWVITLGTAGPYCVSYTGVLLLTYGIGYFLERKQKKRDRASYLVWGLHALLPFCLYLVSNSFAVEDHAGATGRAIGEVLQDNWIFFPKFLIKSLASMAVGEEVMMDLLTRLNTGMALCYLAGIFIAGAYLLALWMQVRERLYERSVLPLMLIFAGGLNHLLVLGARWIFENSDYGMSSRYALQYQAGILGIILTFALFFQRRRRAGAVKWAAVLISLVILAGNGYTTYKELKKAPYRKEYGCRVEEAALGYEEISDEELEALFQYHHGPEKIRQALRILEEQKWNVYGGKE